MMDCRHCNRPCDLFLCQGCTTTFDNMVAELPWLLAELETTIRCQDKLNAGSVGASAPDSAVPLNLSALDVKREALAAINTVTWATGLNGRAVARDFNARDHYRTIAKLVGDGPEPGLLVKAINRSERRYYGPCTKIVGRTRDGHNRECGTDLYTDREADTVTCPECGDTTTTQWQLEQTKNRSDLRTLDMLLDAMRNLGETIGRNRAQQWINTGRLQRRGYYNRDRGITDKRIKSGDPAVYSLDQARDLWTHTHQKRKATG